MLLRQIPAVQWGIECPECSKNQTICDPSNLNMPSIAVSAVAGRKTVFRMLTNVKGSAEFTAKVVAPAGFSVELQPQTFTSKLGDTTLVRVHINRLPGTVYNVWREGAVTWTSSLGTTTRIPIVLKAARLASKPAEVRLKSWSPKYHYYVEPEWAGSMITRTTAFKASKVYKGAVSSRYEAVTVTLPPGVWSYVRFAMFNDDLPSWQNVLPAGNDLDLSVHQGNQLVGSSQNDYNSQEEVNIEQASGTYTVHIQQRHSYEPTAFKLHVWYVNFSADATSNLRSSPNQAKPVTVDRGLFPTRVDLTFKQDLHSLASSGERFLGAVLYYKGTGSSSTGGSSRNGSRFVRVVAQTLVSLV